MSLNAGVPRMIVSRAKMVWHFGQVQADKVKSILMRSLKHLINAPLPPFRYLNSFVLHLVQKISTVLVGPFLLGLAIKTRFKGLFIPFIRCDTTDTNTTFIHCS